MKSGAGFVPYVMSLFRESLLIRWFLGHSPSEPVLETSRITGGFFRFLNLCFSPDRWNRAALGTAAQWMLGATLFASLFVPRILIGSVDSAYRIDLRMEDFFLLAAVLMALGFMVAGGSSAGRTESGTGGLMQSLPVFPSVEKAFLLFLILSQASILQGMWLKTIDKPLVSLLYLVKWLQYFLVFLFTTRLIRDGRDSRFFIKAFFAVGIMIALYGFWEHFFPTAKAVYPNYYRLFERPPFHGDANHVGGFLVLWTAFFTGFFLSTEKKGIQAALLAALALAFFTLIWTYSRKSYFALAAALLSGFLFRGCRRRLIFLCSLFTLLALLLPTRLAERILDLGEAISSPDPFHSSWAGNWVMWQKSLWNFQDFALFGAGLGARHRLFYESQYVLLLSETGIAGALCFGVLLVFLVKEIAARWPAKISPWFQCNREKWAGWPSGEDSWAQSLARGWWMGFAGLAVHNLSCVSWTVSKIAIPFWFLTAVVLASLKFSARSRHGSAVVGQ